MLKKNRVASLLIAVLGASSALAEGEFYMGVEGGFAFADLGAESAASLLASETGRTVTYTEDQGAGYFRIFGEYELTDAISVEAGYFNSSSLDATFSFSGTSTTLGAGVKASGFDLGAKFYPSEKFYLKAGMHQSELEGTLSVTISGTTYSTKLTERGAGTYFGAGYNFNENLAAGYTYLSDVGGDSDSSAGLLYLAYRF